MKLIRAIIKPFKLDDVREALVAANVQGMTISEVVGVGRQKGHSELYGGAEYAAGFIPKIVVEVCVSRDLAQIVVDAVLKAAFTGHIGDGKIFVFPVERVVRIRTGETDEIALV